MANALCDNHGMTTRTFENGKRTDLHRPQVFEPTDYACLRPWDTEPEPPNPLAFNGGSFQLQAGYQDALAAHRQYIEDMRREFGGRVPHSCDHCGAAFRYCWSVRHEPTGEVLAIGEVCVANRLDPPGHDAFAMRFIQDKAGRERAINARLDRLAKWAAENTDVAEWLKTRTEDSFSFAREMANLAQRDALSENQTAAVRRLAARQAERDAEFTAKKAAEAVEVVTLAPEGKATVTGILVSFKTYDTDYGTSYKMLVRLSDGNKVFGTTPRAIFDAIYADPTLGELRDLTGRTVTFTATFERKEDHFAYFSRPRKVEVASNPAGGN